MTRSEIVQWHDTTPISAAAAAREFDYHGCPDAGPESFQDFQAQHGTHQSYPAHAVYEWLGY